MPSVGRKGEEVNVVVVFWGSNYTVLSHLYLKLISASFRASLWQKGIEQKQLSLSSTTPRTKVHTQGRTSQVRGLQNGRGARGQAEQLKQH